jgi:hypothetical protein
MLFPVTDLHKIAKEFVAAFPQDRYFDVPEFQNTTGRLSNKIINTIRDAYLLQVGSSPVPSQTFSML